MKTSGGTGEHSTFVATRPWPGNSQISPRRRRAADVTTTWASRSARIWLVGGKARLSYSLPGAMQPF
jgi:hypothetical protein